MNTSKPTPPRPIQPPRYDAILNAKTGILTLSRNDENGSLSYEEIKRWLGDKNE